MTAEINACPVFMPPVPHLFTAGTPVGAKICRVGGAGRDFEAATNGFQSDDGLLSPTRQAVQAAVREAHAAMLKQVQPQMSSEVGLRLINSAQAKALDAIFQHAEDPAKAEELYAAGRYAARIGVEDLAVALSELRIHGGAPEDCARMEKALCKMMGKDGLGNHSGFSAWHGGNCYGEVNALASAINAMFDALPHKPDIFLGAMQREVMPAIRRYIENNFGNQSYATWQKLDAAGGLISRAAAEAADRMTDSMCGAEPGGAGALRAKVNQWRVAQHWAEMMRPLDTTPAPAGPILSTPSATAAAAGGPRQTNCQVLTPIIVIGGHEAGGTLMRLLEQDESNPAGAGGVDTGLCKPQERMHTDATARPETPPPACPEATPAVTLRNKFSRPLAPFRQVIRPFKYESIGAKGPLRSSAHVGSLLHILGNRISTTGRPLLRSVSHDYAQLRNRPASLLPDYTPLSTASRAIQVGPGFEPVRGN